MFLFFIRNFHDAVADGQGRRQYDLIRKMLRIVQTVKQHFYCHLTHDLQMCSHTGQRRLCQDGQWCVIETDNRHILRNAKSDFAQVADSGDRRLFVVGKKCCRDMIFLFQSLSDLGRTVFCRKSGINDQMLIEDSGIFHIIDKILASCLQGRAFFLV